VDITIEPFDIKKDDVDRTAWLFYITDPGIMGMFFGNEKKAIAILKKLIPLGNNHFSHKHILCARQGSEIVGILAGFDGRQNRIIERECGQEYVKALGFLKSLRAGLVALVMQNLFRKKLDDNEFYVNNLCVAPSGRSRGIGAALLAEIFKRHEKVSLGVNANNHRGMQFYKRNGFEIESGHRFKFVGKTFGVYNMVWTRKGSCCGSGQDSPGN